MVDVIEENEQLVIRIRNQEFARYQFGPACWKPFLYPLRAANGLSLLADAPLDHLHHHGFWVAHARVNDTDFWLERPYCGRILHRAFDKVSSSAASGLFTESCEWVNPGGSVVLKDTRTFTFYDSDPEARSVDFELVLRCPGKEQVTLSPTNEAGLPVMRVAEPLAPRNGGALQNSVGKNKEKETYRERACWVDCSGKLGRLTCGIALFDHPENPEHPTPWFTRDYGPIAPNYGLFREDPIVIEPKKPLRLRYRIFAHTGNVEEGGVQAAWDAYRGGSAS